jgi:hypothetical protein
VSTTPFLNNLSLKPIRNASHHHHMIHQHTGCTRFCRQVATLVTTPAQYVADAILHPDATRSMGTFNIAGGALIVATFAIIIARDYTIIQRKGRESTSAYGGKTFSVQ